jgi:hypothetical protein
MARKKVVITEDMVPLQGNSAKYVKLLHQFAEQEGAAALPLLERILAEGSVKMIAQAFEELLELDVPKAEAFALEQADASLRTKNQKERALRQHWLFEVATPACLERAAALGLELQRLFAPQLERAYDWLPGHLVRLRAEGRATAWLRDVVSSLAWSLDGRPATYLTSLIDAPTTPRDEKAALIEAFVGVRHAVVCRRPDVPSHLRVDAAFGLPTAECYDTLTAQLAKLPPVEALAVFRQGNMLGAPMDDRWVGFWMKAFAGNDDAQEEALKALLEAGRNDRTASGDRAKQAYAAIEQPRRRVRLLEGLKVAAHDYNGTGHARLFGPLQQLETLAHAEDLPLLRELAAVVWKLSEGSQAPAYWFGKAIAAIEKRTGA